MQIIINNTFFDSFKAGNITRELEMVDRMANLLLEVKGWMTSNWLKMNDAKTEFVYFGFPKQMDKVVTQSIQVGGSSVPHTDSIKLPGVTLTLDYLLNSI